jgi:uncharacterized protein YecE (DUF72 family)
MAEILISTCSWTDPTLIKSGQFYPDWAKSAETRLQFYASQFNLVEVDSSYYALLNEKASRLWVERTSEGFVFDVKAFRLLPSTPPPCQPYPRTLETSCLRA